MADKTSQIKVTFKNDGAKSGIRELKDETKRAASDMKGSLSSAFSEGMKGGTDAVKGLLSSVKSMAGTIGGLLGGIGFADMVKGALEANSKMGDLSAGIRFAGGTARDAAAAQKQARESALAWAQDSMKVVDAFQSIRGETGSIDFAQQSIDTVSQAARGAHKSLESMAGIAGTLNEKFGISAAELPDALADIVGLSEKGGIQFEDMAEKLGMIGAFAKSAGLEGREGLGQIAGLLNMADNANGSFRKGLSAVGVLLENLSNTSARSKIGASLGISQKDLGGNATQQIEAIMRATKGQKSQLEKAFGGETLKLLVDMGKTYGEALSATAGDAKTKQAAATAALHEALTSASKSTVAWGDIQKEAAAEMNESPQKIATATEKLRQAFQSEKMQAALGKIIDKLPALADGIAKIVEMVLDNPLAAGGVAIGATFAKGALETLIAGAFKGGAAAAAPGLTQALAGGAGPFATALGPLMGPIGLALGAGIAIMLVAAMADAKRQQEKRSAEAKDAAAAITGHDQSGKQLYGSAGVTKHTVAGALEAQTGIEFNPDADLTDAEIAAMSANQDERDALEARRLKARSARNQKVTGPLAEKFGAGPVYNARGERIDPTTGKVMTTSEMPSTPVSFVDPFAGGFSGKESHGTAAPPGTTTAAAAAPAASAGTAPTYDPQLLAQMLGTSISSKELRVRVTNPDQIGGSAGAPSGAATSLPPGWTPR